MKKKYRTSLVLGWIAFLSGILLTLLAVDLSRGMCKVPPEIAVPLLTMASLTAEAPSSYALGVFLIMLGFVIFLTRRNKRATMFFSVPYLVLCYLTLYAFYHLDPANPFQIPYLSFFPVEKRTLVFVLFILELFLYLAVVIAFRPVDAQIRARTERKLRAAEKKAADKKAAEEAKEQRQQLLLEQELARQRAEMTLEKERLEQEALRQRLKGKDSDAEGDAGEGEEEPEKPAEPERKLSRKEAKAMKKEQLRLMKETEKKEKKAAKEESPEEEPEGQPFPQKEEIAFPDADEKTAEWPEPEKEEKALPKSEEKAPVKDISWPDIDEKPALRQEKAGKERKARLDMEEKPKKAEKPVKEKKRRGKKAAPPALEEPEEPAPKRAKADPRARYEYSSAEPVDPYKPIQFPDFVEIPEFQTINPNAVGRATGSYAPEQLEEDLETDIFSQVKADTERQAAPAEPAAPKKYSYSGQTSFSKGGIVEATLESMSQAKAAPAEPVKRNPIIGYEPKKQKEPSKAPAVPSNLSPEHPRYKMFESLKEQPQGVSHFPAKSFKAEAPAKKETYGSTYVKEMLRDIEENKAAVPETPSAQVKGAPARRAAVPRKESAVETAAHAAPQAEPEPLRPSSARIAPEPESAAAVSESVESVFVKPQRRPVPEPEVPSRFEDGEEPALTDSDFLLSVGIGGLQSNMQGFASINERNRARYSSPSETFLDDYPSVSTELDEETRAQGETIVNALADFNTEVTLTGIVKGPTVTMYEFKLKDGTPVSKVTSRHDEISYYLGGQHIRILAPIAGKQAVGVEVPNKKRAVIGFKDMLSEYKADPAFKKLKVPMILGRTITGEPKIIDVAKMPHMLIAGTTGSGKSVCINTFICTILYTRSPKEVRLMMVDPKFVELSMYNGIPHLLTPVITDAKKTVKALNWLVDEMERRYQMLSRFGVRNIEGLNNKIVTEKIPCEKLPYIVLIMDEFADLMTVAKNDIETSVSRLTAKARAAGIHLILATQRPSADVITGTIKNNIAGRIAFAVSSNMNSRIILDEGGAESLLGRGDMLLLDPNTIGLTRIQGAFLSDEEVDAIVRYETRNNTTDYLKDELFEDAPEEGGEDEENEAPPDEDSDEALYERAKEICYERGTASASYLQRRMKIGYNRAARLIEMMEDEGIVGPPQGSKPREIIKFK